MKKTIQVTEALVDNLYAKARASLEISDDWGAGTFHEFEGGGGDTRNWWSARAREHRYSDNAHTDALFVYTASPAAVVAIVDEYRMLRRAILDFAEGKPDADALLKSLAELLVAKTAPQSA